MYGPPYSFNTTSGYDGGLEDTVQGCGGCIGNVIKWGIYLLVLIGAINVAATAPNFAVGLFYFIVSGVVFFLLGSVVMYILALVLTALFGE